MANEVYVSAQGDLLATSILAKVLEMLLHQKPFARRLCAFRGDTRATGSSAVKVPQIDDDDIGEVVAEGSAPSANTALTDGSYTLTPGRIALKRVVSNRLMGIDATGLLNEISLAIYNFNGIMRGFDALVAAAVASLTGTAGTSGAAMTVTDWFTAQQTLVERLVEGRLAAFLHPRQWTELQTDLRGEVGPWQLNTNVQAAVASSNGKSFKGTLNDVEIWTSSQVADANGGVNHGGAMMQIPQDANDAGGASGDAALSYAEGSPEPVTLIAGHKVMEPGGKVYSTFSADGDKDDVSIVSNYYAVVGVADANKGIKVLTKHT